MDTNKIIIKGARQHNLKNISLNIPKNNLIVFTGVSGSGKSSLAFDTIYAEGQRRYVESLSSYARQFLGLMNKPDVDTIEGLSPSISINQKSTTHNPRSTVGTVTEIYDYMRLLYARVGHPHCSKCGKEISRQDKSQIVKNILLKIADLFGNTRGKYLRVLILAPLVRDRKGEFTQLFENLRSKGFSMVRVDGYIYDLNEDIILIKTNKHTIDVIIDRFTFDKKTVNFLSKYNKINSFPKSKLALITKLSESVDSALELSQGLITLGTVKDSSFDFPQKPKNIEDHIYSENFACPICNISIAEIEPRSFSFNTPYGACEECSGIGTILIVDPKSIVAPELTLSEGAIIPFAKIFYHDTWYSRVVKRVAEQNNIDITKPLKSYSDKEKNILFYGTGERVYTVYGTNRFGEDTLIEESFTGLIPELTKKHSETKSDFVRREIERYMKEEVCQKCQGKRLKKESLTVTIDNLSISDATKKNITDAFRWISKLMLKESLLSKTEKKIAFTIIKEIKTRLQFLIDVGLEYLTLSRNASTLSGGEAQRIRLASQIGTGLSGVLYVLDEPSIGLHAKDNKKLIDTLVRLKEIGNTVLVVEHDRDMIMSADYIVDFGPGAGKHGGNIVADGSLKKVLASKSLTAKYLKYKKAIKKININGKLYKDYMTINGAKQFNLKNISIKFPLGALTCVTGVSGSGKSTLVVETLFKALYKHFNPYSKAIIGDYDNINGIENINKVILIDQSPIGRTPRSNPATYTSLFTYIRQLYSMLQLSKMRGYSQGRFSFNVKGGRCEECEGEGQKRIEMQFLSDVYITCEVCKGTRFNHDTLDIVYKDKNIAQILNMTIEEANVFFSNHPYIKRKLEVLVDVGLGYMHLGQPAPTLSGGEAQRVKLATELMKTSHGQTVYILDEPTTGLHFADLEKLLNILYKLTEKGNTVIVIEHNMDVIKNADWIIDLGPDGGNAGGQVVAVGSPKEIAKSKKSYTGDILRKVL